MSVRSLWRAAFGGRSELSGPVAISEVSRAEFADVLADAIAIWARAMDYPPSLIGPRIVLAGSHLSQPGLRAFLARDDHGRLLGFAYGYHSEPGQWWHDEVHRLAATAQAGQLLSWLPDSYELCELHVDPDFHGRGIGRELLTTFLARVPADRVLLSTPEAPTAAVSLYERMGFRKLGTDFTFAGDARPFAIYGLELTRDQ